MGFTLCGICNCEPCICRLAPVPHRPRAELRKGPETYHANVPTTTQPRMPTPLYVTQQDKSIRLKFNTQEEADTAARYLSELATQHANRTHEQQVTCAHQYSIDDVDRYGRHRCKLCGMLEDAVRG